MNIKKGKKGSPHKYELSLKRKICEELLSGQITIGDLAKKYNVAGSGTIGRWLKWYQAEQQELVSSSAMNPSQINENSDENKSDKKIEEELRLAKAKIATLETMIDIAEEQFNIEIRKKSGTKQSSE
jgi:transposase